LGFFKSCFWDFSFFNNYCNYFIFGVCGLGFWGFFFPFLVWCGLVLGFSVRFCGWWSFRRTLCLFVCLLVGWFVVVGTGNWLLLLLSLLLLLLAKTEEAKQSLELLVSLLCC